MKNQDQIEIIKAQVREKDNELRRVNSDFEQVLAEKDKKLGELQNKISEQEIILKGVGKEAKPEEAKPEEAKPIKNEKLEKELLNLEEKNKSLNEILKEDKKEKKLIEKQKKVLMDEYKKLKKNAEKQIHKLKKDIISGKDNSGIVDEQLNKLERAKEIMANELKLAKEQNSKWSNEVDELKVKLSKTDEMQQEIVRLEAIVEDFKKNFNQIAKENEDISKSSEGLSDSSDDLKGEKDSEKSPTELIDNLKDKLNKLKKEKEDLFNQSREKIENAVTAERTKLKKQFEDKLKTLEEGKVVTKKTAKAIMEDEDGEGWMATFADMVTLLLTFFILMYSLAEFNVQKFKKEILGEARNSIGVLEILDNIEIKTAIKSFKSSKDNDILKTLKDLAKEDSDNFEIGTDNSKIIIRVPGNSLFQSGDASLRKEARFVLDKLLVILKKFPKFKINIQGHTDDIPISTVRFPNNWDLSAARGTSVLRYFFNKEIDPKKLTATGYSDLFPLYSNDTEMGRSKNRRVEFVLEKEK